MGRHTKGVATFLATFRELTVRRREFEEWAAGRPMMSGVLCTGRMPGDGKRRLMRGGSTSQVGRTICAISPVALATTQASRAMTALFANGRCIWHGGKSTGPTSEDGRARALENLRLGRLTRDARN